MQNEKSESRIRHKWPLPALIGRGFSLRRLEPFGWKVLQSLHEFRLIAARQQALPPLTAQCLLVWYLSRLHNPAGLNRRTSDKSTASWQESIRQTCIGIAGKSSRTEKMCPFVWRTFRFFPPCTWAWTKIRPSRHLLSSERVCDYASCFWFLNSLRWPLGFRQSIASRPCAGNPRVCERLSDKLLPDSLPPCFSFCFLLPCGQDGRTRNWATNHDIGLLLSET